MPALYDLVIVGGGLGGATLARSMAQRGARTLVLERELQFKDRVRGEFITSWGVAEARALGIYELLTERVAHQVPWADIYLAGELIVHRDVVNTTPSQLPCLTFYHPAMQELLLAAAAGSGAEVRRGVTVREVRAGASATVVISALPASGQADGRSEEIRARLSSAPTAAPPPCAPPPDSS